METESLFFDVSGDDAGVQRVTVAGEMDMLSADALHDAVVDLLRRHRPRRIEMDLRGLSFLDSAGIRALLLCHAEAERADCPLILVEPHPRVHRVLHITGLLSHFNLPEAQSVSG